MNIIKICHIRGKKNYYKQKDYNLGKKGILNSISYSNKNNIIKYWESVLNINYFDFRENIRNICIENIKNKQKYFDVIIENDEDFIEYINTIDKNQYVLYYAQDDDDLLIGNILNNTFTEIGTYCSPILKFDPIPFYNKNKDNIKNKVYKIEDCFFSSSKNPDDIVLNVNFRTCNTVIFNKASVISNTDFIYYIIKKLYNVQAPLKSYHEKNNINIIYKNNFIKEHFLGLYFFHFSSISNLKKMRDNTKNNTDQEIKNFIKRRFINYCDVLLGADIKIDGFNELKSLYIDVYNRLN